MTVGLQSVEQHSSSEIEGAHTGDCGKGGEVGK